MSEIIHIDKFRPSPTDSFFFDNNVWMFIHYPIGNYAIDKQKKYSGLLSSLITLKCNIFINALLLSEFINACLKADFKEWSSNEFNQGKKLLFKDHFVGSDDYKQSVAEILSSVAQIRKVSQPGTDDFHALNIDAILQGMYIRDFNDNYYLALSERKKWTLVSDDSDMVKNIANNVKVVTARKI